MNALPVYGNRYKKKIRTCGDRIYTNLSGLNLPENGVECESFTVISIDFLLIYGKKYCLQVYLDSPAFNTVHTEMLDHLEDNIF